MIEFLIFVVFGICVMIFKFVDYLLVLLFIGFILGIMFEDNFVCLMNFYDGVSFVWDCLMMLGFLVILVLLVVFLSYCVWCVKVWVVGIVDGD